jgi:hypothetical protein
LGVERLEREWGMERTMAAAFIALVVLLGADRARSDASDHRYKEGDPVPLFANKVGPFHNPR